MEEITNKKGIPAGAVVGITILAAIIFGAGAYMYANNQATQEKDALNTQIVALQNEVLSARKTATTTSDSSTPATNTDDKAASTEKSSVPSDWKTYKNTKYGYSLNYPNNLKLLARDEDLNNIEVNSTAASIEVATDEGGIFDVIFENIQFTTDEMKGVFGETDPKNVTLTPATIAGNPAYQVKYHATSDEMSDLYFVKSPSGTVLRLMIAIDNIDAQNNIDAQKILSSFIFTK